MSQETNTKWLQKEVRGKTFHSVMKNSAGRMKEARGGKIATNKCNFSTIKATDYNDNVV